MLEQLLMYLQNWFRVRDSVDGIHPGTYTIEGGGIALPFLRDGQYFRIMGSVFKNGLHRYAPDMGALEDETFSGTIWALAIPKDVVNAATEGEEWLAKNAGVVGPYSSESFGGYSGVGWQPTQGPVRPPPPPYGRRQHSGKGPAPPAACGPRRPSG